MCLAAGREGMIPPFITATFQPDNTTNTTAERGEREGVASFLVAGIKKGGVCKKERKLYFVSRGNEYFDYPRQTTIFLTAWPLSPLSRL